MASCSVLGLVDGGCGWGSVVILCEENVVQNISLEKELCMHGNMFWGL